MRRSSPSPIRAASAPSTAPSSSGSLGRTAIAYTPSPTVPAARPARRRHLDPVEGHVEVAALERGDQRLPVVLRELGAHAEAAREPLGDLDLEAGEPAPVARVLEDVRLAALHVAAPAERPPR